MIRLFVPDALAAGAPVIPNSDQCRYLIAVMRLAVGSEILLFNGRDGEWRAPVVEADKRRARLLVGARSRAHAASPDLTLAVALGNFLGADDSPWELLMATGVIYALPPAAIYYAFKRYMVGGLTAGAVKS